jgi:CXXX repeat peptide maturase
MLEHIIVLTDIGAVSFCHYESKEYDKSVSELIPLETFAAIVNYASKHNTMLNVLLGPKSLPDDYLRILCDISHVKIVPYELMNSFPDAIPVLDWERCEQQSFIVEKQIENIIIRLHARSIVDLRRIIGHFINHTKRINFILKDVQELTEENLINFEHQLNKIILIIAQAYRDGKTIELNCISDRLLLKEMNNCNAGLSHVTIAPNGKFYICPGFYYSNPQNDVGSIEEGLKIPNQELLQLDHAPICSICDAFQCKRCVYMNKIITNEINTPSRQQCVFSHLERNASRRLLRRLKPALQNLHELMEIPEVDYLDPFETLQEQKTYNKIKLYRICKGNI